jgi:uncharacterized protein YkwD
MRLSLTLPAALTSLIAAAACAAAPSAALATSAAPPVPLCADADLPPTPANLPAIRVALLCLHNEERISRGLRPLAENPRLEAAANAHAAEMVNDGYFAHASADGSSFSARIIRSGYVGRDSSWLLGENLAWATGDLATPDNLMRAWMGSPDHRSNILTRAYRDIGIGIVLSGPDARVTVTADFGGRR